MKVLTVLFAACIMLSVSCTHVKADGPQPVVSKKYTNLEIEQIVRSYKSSNSKDIRPSDNLMNKFKADFPKATDLDWEVASEVYQVEFEIGFTDYEAYYDKDGELLAYTQEYSQNLLPAVVINAVIAKYPDYNFEDVKKRVSGDRITYKIELEKKRGQDIKIVVNPDGTIVNEWID